MKKTDTTVVVVEESGGMKGDGNKPRYELIDWDFVDDFARVLTFGAAKYEDYNWQKVTPIRFIGAAFRHLTAYAKGEKLDPETGISHLAHLACSLMFLHWNDRRKNADTDS